MNSNTRCSAGDRAPAGAEGERDAEHGPRAAPSLPMKPDSAPGCLKQVFVKTGRNRQVDPVRSIFGNPVRRRARARGDKRSVTVAPA